MDNELIQKLSENIDKSHKKFLENVGEIPYKVSADYVLLLTNATTALTLIATFLMDKSVIDNYEVLKVGECNKISLSKKGLDFNVDVLTDGVSIRLCSVNCMEDSVEWQKLYPSKDGWNWEDVSRELLDFIHTVIYKGQQAKEIRFDSLMRGENA